MKQTPECGCACQSIDNQLAIIEVKKNKQSRKTQNLATGYNYTKRLLEEKVKFGGNYGKS
jgi:hypothetical protein